MGSGDRSRGGPVLNRVTTAIFVVELVVLAVWFRYVAWTPWKAVGALLVACGMLLLITARLQLGRSFSVRAKAKRLVTTGVYARVRNPIYLSGMVVIGGAALLLARWWPVVLLLLIAPVQWARAGREARVLEGRFGEEYRAYRARTWF